jgi:hypothetical protein
MPTWSNDCQMPTMREGNKCLTNNAPAADGFGKLTPHATTTKPASHAERVRCRKSALAFLGMVALPLTW